MRDARSIVVMFALLAGLMLMPGRANGQAVGFTPGIGQIPDGVSLNVTPVVSADRRYVRISLSPLFQTINGFQNFPVPAAIAGGGNGGGGLGGLGGGLGGGGLGAGANGGGFRSVMGGPADFAAWYPALGVPQEYVTRHPDRLPAKPLKAKTSRSRKPLPDPVIVPIKKGEKKAGAAGG
jgi:hypothetical protein